MNEIQKIGYQWCKDPKTNRLQWIWVSDPIAFASQGTKYFYSIRCRDMDKVSFGVSALTCWLAAAILDTERLKFSVKARYSTPYVCQTGESCLWPAQEQVNPPQH